MAARKLGGRGGRSQPSPKVALTPTTRTPGRLLHDAHQRLSAGLVRSLQQVGYDLSAEAWVILFLLWENDNLTQVEIGSQIGKDRHQTSRLIDVLEQANFVERKSTTTDRRLKRVALTQAGRRARLKVSGVATEYLEAMFAGLTQAEYDIFVGCLEHIIGRPLPKEG